MGSGVSKSRGDASISQSSSKMSFRTSDREEVSGDNTFTADHTTILDHFRQGLKLSQVLEDEYGLDLMRPIAEGVNTLDVLEFWSYCVQFRLTFEKKMADGKLAPELESQLLKFQHNPRILNTCVTKEELDVLELQVSSTNLNSTMLDQIQAKLFTEMEGEILEEFKKSKACQDFCTHHLRLEDMINDDHAMFYFGKYLLGEFSTESVGFYEDVNLYRRMWTPN